MSNPYRPVSVHVDEEHDGRHLWYNVVLQLGERSIVIDGWDTRDAADRMVTAIDDALAWEYDPGMVET